MESRQLIDKLEYAIEQLEQARPFNKVRFRSAVLDVGGRLAGEPGGVDALYQLAARCDRAGIFADTPWDQPATLLPGLVRNTLEQGDRQTVLIELLSQLRLLAVSNGVYTHAGIPAEQARHFLAQVMALNLDHLLAGPGEAMRARLGRTSTAVSGVFRYLLENIGFADILGSLVHEVRRIMSQRPLQVDSVKSMITQIALARSRGEGGNGAAAADADRLVSNLFGPTATCADDPGVQLYLERVVRLSAGELESEASAFARAMHENGLVSDYHAVFLRWLALADVDLPIARESLQALALGLSSTGLDALRTFHDLVGRLIEGAVHIGTAQSVYGLALILESGMLYSAPVAPALWRQIDLRLSPVCAEIQSTVFGTQVTPATRLLAGTIQVLGQPLGIGQGNNPTCQAARAISMWASNDPDYLLHLISRAAHFDEIVLHFEGEPISSAGAAGAMIPLDTDPVSVLLVPHLDLIYRLMGELCAGRGDDPHRWINPELHGWWVGRECFLAVDIQTGGLRDYDAFLHRFYCSYHPFYNGNQPIIHPQPAGLAVTDSTGIFVGWHAITLIRVALDGDNVMRLYFFNPNNDSGQDWGAGVKVSTHGNGERHGEASLPFAELASRLYLFHDDTEALVPTTAPDAAELQEVKQMALSSWAAGRDATAQAPTVAGSSAQG
ncbi:MULTISPECIES: hypothetical protein [Microbulbifer]|uniref:hypothetical protein n=1 Tax=Microbulbifer TaxID=48073 RepID=UPI001E5AA5A4|nr:MULTISPECIES: hypothetical protein [Microbulbifer]UHQ54605.1 hypothetical protein LVE68_14005 [Microbulbifer sp. YPW16]